jgi:hypothetical protein
VQKTSVKVEVPRAIVAGDLERGVSMMEKKVLASKMCVVITVSIIKEKKDEDRKGRLK